MKLALRLLPSLGHWPDDAELRQWLKGNGLTWVGGAWFSSVNGPTALQPDEILESATTETSDGVTFVDRRPSVLPDGSGQGPPDQPESA